MTPYRFRALSAVILFLLLAFAILAFGAVDQWAQTIFEIGIFGLAAAWALRIALGSLRPVWNPFYLPLGVATAWTAAQAWLGLSVHPYRTGAEALKWLALWLMFVMASHVFADRSIRRSFSLALVWFAFGLCAFGLVQHFTSPGLMYWSIPIQAGRVFGPLFNANHFVTLLELFVPAALLLALRPSAQRLIYVGVCGMLLAAAVVCASRAGIVVITIEIIVVLGVSVLARGRSRSSARRRRLGLAVASVAALAIVLFTVTRAEALSERFQDEQPYRLRWSVAQATWRLFASKPWTGYGAGSFEQVYPSAAPVDIGLSWTHAHNDPLQFAMEWGVPGLGIMGWILWLLLRQRWPREVWLKVVLPVLGVLAHSWFDFPFQIPAVTAAWLVTLALLDPSGRRGAMETARREASAGGFGKGSAPNG